MAKRIASSSVNWAAIAERVHPQQRLNFNNFKVKSDKYLRRLVSITFDGTTAYAMIFFTKFYFFFQPFYKLKTQNYL